MAGHRKEPLPTNPRVLRWARETAGRSPEEAAEHLKVAAAKIARWETPDEVRPTVGQARKLADYYGRSFLELFLPDPPDLKEPELIPDFRLYREADDPNDSRVMKEVQLWAEAKRTDAIDLYDELVEKPNTVPKSILASIKDDEEKLAEAVREAIEFPIEMQVGLPTNARTAIPTMIRERIETLGIITLRRSDLRAYGVRGFCITDSVLPIIVFASESPNAQAFTLGHELAHVLIQQSAISGPIPRRGGRAEVRAIEEWCDRFSAAFLMPKSAVVVRMNGAPLPNRTISDENLGAVADYFGVSRHAMLIRLMHLGFVPMR